MSIIPSISEILHFQNLTLKIQGQGQMTMILHNYRSRQFHRTSNGINQSIHRSHRYGFRKVWPKCCLIWQVFGPWANPYGAYGQTTMTLHNYRSGQVHETLNGVNPYSSFRDMHSSKFGPNLLQIWQIFGPWASPYGANGQMGKWPWQCTITGLDNSTELQMEKIRQAVTEIWVLQVWQPTDCPPARTVTTPSGWRGKKPCSAHFPGDAGNNMLAKNGTFTHSYFQHKTDVGTPINPRPP